VPDLLTVVRTLHYGALTLLVGAFAFLLLVARQAFRKGEPESIPGFERFDHLLFKLSAWSLFMTLITGFMWFWVQASSMSGKPLGQALSLEIVGNVLYRTQFGQVWQVRLAILVLLAGFLLLKERERDAKDWIALRIESVMLGGGLIIALAWAGHAAATQGIARIYHLTADSIHLLAVGIWLGGLLPLAILLSSARKSQEPFWAPVAREATRRFSALAFVSFSCIVLTGVVNGLMIVGDIPHLLGTPYGRLLLLKLFLLLPLIGIAAMNLLRLKPQLSAEEGIESSERLSTLIVRLRRNVVAEICLGFTILFIVGALGTTPPARHIQPSWPVSFRWSWEVTKNLPGVRVAVLVGAVGILLGAMLLGYGVLRRRYRPWALGVGLAFVGTFAFVPLRFLAVDAHPTTYVRPKVPYQALSIANGRALYHTHCEVCHGEAGYGDGPAAQGLTPKPADLTAKHTADHTVGDLFWWLTHGIKGSAMPGFQDRLSVEDRWDLINFLRALSASEQARSLGPLVEPNPWLSAPDFVYGIGLGENRALKDLRGDSIVLLVLFTLPDSRPRLAQLCALIPRLGELGARSLAIPMGNAGGVYRQLGGPGFLFTVVTEGNREIADTYALFRRSFAAEGLPPAPHHLEFLIDRQGYIRARWLPRESIGWADPDKLFAEIDRLNTERPGEPAPLEHVH